MAIIFIALVIIAVLIGRFGIEKSIQEDQAIIEKSSQFLKFIKARYHHREIDPRTFSSWY
jgi:hypothetical protein